MKMPFFSHPKTKKHGILQDGPVDDDGRCKSCDGACCRSFPSVDLTWQEYQRLRELGAVRLNFSLSGPHRLIIENGCEFLAAGRCTIYQDRPDICRRFFCQDA
jgi:Fe-S-cluster containining protein